MSRRWNHLAECSRRGMKRETVVTIAREFLRKYGEPSNLLASGETNTKTAKGSGARSYNLSLVPADTLGMFNFCAFASKGCSAGCLYTAGRGRMRNVSEGRLRKAFYFVVNRESFICDLEREIGNKVSRASGLIAFRLNIVSDVSWEAYPGINQYMWDPARVRFYDYTKNPIRYRRYLAGDLPTGYHLTFSLSENNESLSREFLRMGGNVAVPFDCKDPKDFPAYFMGYPVINGETTDFRFQDPQNVIVGLTAKGLAKRDTSGFVVKVNDIRTTE